MVRKFQEYNPNIHHSVFLAESSNTIGQVEIKEYSSLWYHTVLRGDVNKISVGSYTNIQDNTVVHVDHDTSTTIGNYVTIGHSAVIHSCIIHDHVLVGMGSIILNDVIINENVIIGAGSLIPPGKEIPSNSLVFGSPAKVIRSLTEEEIKSIHDSAIHYHELAVKY